MVFSYYDARYVLGDNDQVVITQFGNVIGEAKNVPGEYFKIPIIQKAHYFKKNLHLAEWVNEIPTKDKEFLILKNRAFWKIVDPIQYLKSLNSYNLTYNSVIDYVGEAQREFVTTHGLSDLLGTNTENFQLIDIQCDNLVKDKFLQLANRKFKSNGVVLNNIDVNISRK